MVRDTGGRMMKRALIAVLTMLGMLVGPIAATAGDDLPTREKGRALFTDSGLGTTGKSCDDCHPNGKGAEKAAGKDYGEIARIVNACITYSLKGRALEGDSAEMRSLILYIRSLGDKTKPATPK